MSLSEHIQTLIDNKTKPLGSLGQLETLAKQICLVQHTTQPSLQKPSIIVFAADHGLAAAGVSAYPQAVTAQMVHNFVHQGAAINVFCRQNQLQLSIVDAGVASDFERSLPIVHEKVGYGTANCLHQKALSSTQLEQCFSVGKQQIEELKAQDCNIVGLGEMGIGNTSSAALIMHYLTGLPISQCAGRGTGVDDDGFKQKLATLAEVVKFHGQLSQPLDILQAVGGFEIAMMCSAMLEAAKQGMLILVDGFIASAAALVATKLQPACLQSMVFCHQSNEAGHQQLLAHMGAQPLLQLGMRLGEGSGCALAYPLVASAVHFINEMASFDTANISRQGSE